MLSLHPAGPVLPPDSSPLEQCLLLEWGGGGGAVMLPRDTGQSLEIHLVVATGEGC